MKRGPNVSIVLIIILLFFIFRLLRQNDIVNEQNCPGIPVALPHLAKVNETMNETLVNENSYHFLVSQYKLKQGRDPPPHFEKWYEFAETCKCSLQGYDKIYQDLAPFYNFSKQEIQKRIQLIQSSRNVETYQFKNGKLKGPNQALVNFLKPVHFEFNCRFISFFQIL